MLQKLLNVSLYWVLVRLVFIPPLSDQVDFQSNLKWALAWQSWDAYAGVQSFLVLNSYWQSGSFHPEREMEGAAHGLGAGVVVEVGRLMVTLASRTDPRHCRARDGLSNAPSIPCHCSFHSFLWQGRIAYRAVVEERGIVVSFTTPLFHTGSGTLVDWKAS